MNLAAQVQERSDPSAALEPLLRLVHDEMAEVNNIILSQARSDVALIPELARHLINSGGKRLRPMLTIGAAKMCGYEGTGHIMLAASVEFMHTATLLHDDVVDESDMRRGKKSARMLWGNQASVLVGDFLLGQAFRMMVDVGSLGALKVLSEASSVIAEGEVWQLAASKNLATTEEEYLNVIISKTAALFAAAAEIGAILTDRGAEEQAALRLYGTNIGLAFQLIDDALDYSGEAASLGKCVGDDFREGKITLPVVLSYRRGTPEERAFWRRTLQEGAIEDSDLEHAIQIMRRHNAIEETIQRAVYYGKEAREALSIFPAGEARKALIDAVDFSIARMH
jgi:octaprenyl-diphosphate synthase